MARLKDHALAFFTVFIWGITFVSTKYITGFLSSLEILFIRYVIAYAVLWIICPRPLLFCGLKHEAYMFFAALSGAAAYQYLENLSVSYTSPASVSFITASAPLFTALLAHKVLGEKVSLKIFLGMAISLFGIFLICFGDSETIETGLLGDVIISLGIWLWAVYSVLVKKISAFGYNGFLVTRRLFLYSVIVLFPFTAAGFDSDRLASLKQPSVIINLLFLGILASAVCFATWNRSVEKLGATTTSKYLFISPMVTLLTQWICSMGKPGPAALLGMIITLTGLFISELDLKRNRIIKKNIN